MAAIFDRNGLLEQIKLNPDTKVGTDICPTHVVEIWDTINILVKKILCSGRGVKLPGLFSITYNVLEVETPSGEGNVSLQRSPHIFLANELVMKHALHVKKPRYHFEIFEADLNMSNVAKICHLTRDAVETCLQEIISAFDKALATNDQVELWLTKIGKVIVQSKAVNVGYCPSFLNLLGYSEGVKKTFINNLSKFSEDYEEYMVSSKGSSEEEEQEHSARQSAIEEEDLEDYDEDMEDEEDEGDEEEEEKEPSLSKKSTTSPPETPPETSAASSVDRHSIYSRYSAETEPFNIVSEEEQVEKPEELSPEEEIRRATAMKTLVERDFVAKETFSVWETISKYIIKKLKEGVGVKIVGLGTFSCQTLRPDFANAEEESTEKSGKFPLFKISPHLKEINGLKEENHSYQCNVPIISLNTRIIATEAKLGHGIVDGIIAETLQSFVLGIISQKNVEFPFPLIGKLSITHRNIQMHFYEKFCEGLFSKPTSSSPYNYLTIPGSMTPLQYHRTPPEFYSVFHYKDMKSVHEVMRVSTPALYHEGKIVRDRNEDHCSFLRKLYAHSHFRFDCSCHNCTEKKETERIGESTYPQQEKAIIKKTLDTKILQSSLEKCILKKNYERVRKACYTKAHTFSFKQSDGSTFSPQPLFSEPNTGHPILDTLSNDKCRLQEALGCWMRKGVSRTLGLEQVARHYDRDYFRKMDQARKEMEMSMLLQNQGYADEEDEEGDPTLLSLTTPHEGSEEGNYLESEAFSLLTAAESHKRMDSISVKSASSTHDIHAEGTGADDEVRSEGSATSEKWSAGATHELVEIALESSLPEGEKGKNKPRSTLKSIVNGDMEGIQEEDSDEGSRVSEVSGEEEAQDADKLSTKRSKGRSKASSQREKSERGTENENDDDEVEDEKLQLQQLYESKWFEYEKLEEEGTTDTEIKQLQVDESEVAMKLGLKKKKKCKEKEVGKPKERVDFGNVFDKDKRQMALTAIVEKAYQERTPKPTEASHALVPQRDFGKKPKVPKEKKVIKPQPTQHIELRPLKIHHLESHHRTTQTTPQPAVSEVSTPPKPKFQKSRIPITKSKPFSAEHRPRPTHAHTPHEDNRQPLSIPEPPKPTTPDFGKQGGHVKQANPEFGRHLYREETTSESSPQLTSEHDKRQTVTYGTHQRTTSTTTEPTHDDYGEHTRPESRSLDKAPSLIFKSASDLLYCSPPATFAPKISRSSERNLNVSFSRMVGMDDQHYKHIRRMSLTSADSYRNCSPPPSSCSEMSRREYQIGASPVPKCRFQFQQGHEFDVDDNYNLTATAPPTDTSPSPCKIENKTCYATFCPSQRREAGICYIQSCFNPCQNMDVCGNFNDCVVHFDDDKL